MKPNKGSIKKNSSEKQNNVVVNVASAFGAAAAKGKTIDFKITLRCTTEVFTVANFPIAMKIRDLKGLLEFICGIPYNLQRLSYLDDGELIDGKELQYYDVINGANIIMDIWTIYVGLVQAAVYGSISDALKQGVSPNVDWSSPTADFMYTKDKAKYISERSGIALFIASHRGNFNLVKELIAHGAPINYKSSFGRTATMLAVVANKTEIIDFLLDQNADVDITDINGDSALTIAKKFNNKLGQHRLTQFKWKKRTDAEIKSRKSAMSDDEDIFPEQRFPHQIFDSSKKTWFKGNFMQVYMMQLVPQNEFSGSSLSAPKSVGKQVLKQHKLSRSLTDINKSLAENLTESDEIAPIETRLTFDKWLSQKMKAKRILIEKKKKEAQIISNEKEEIAKEQQSNKTTNDAENNVWMKDYVKSSLSAMNKIDFVAPEKTETQSSPRKLITQKSKTNLTIDLDNTTSSTSTNKMRGSEYGDIYKGMPYDEWIKIRDKFLKAHNMLA